MVASKESKDSCHFSGPLLNFLNSCFNKWILVFNFGMSVFQLLSFLFQTQFISVSVLYSHFQPYFWLPTLVLLFLGLAFPARFFLGYVTCPFQSQHISPFVSLCFFVASPTFFLFPFAPILFLFPLNPLLSVKSLVLILSVLLWFLFFFLHIVLKVYHFNRCLVVCLRRLLSLTKQIQMLNHCFLVYILSKSYIPFICSYENVNQFDGVI